MSDTIIEVSQIERIVIQDIPAPGPTGPQGAAATIQAGTVITTGPSTPAAVTNSGTAGAAVFNFSIPVTPFGNLDGGKADTVYGGTDPVDGGGV